MLLMQQVRRHWACVNGWWNPPPSGGIHAWRTDEGHAMQIIMHGWADRLRLSNPPMPGGEPLMPDPEPDLDAPPPVEEPPVPIALPADPGRCRNTSSAAKRERGGREWSGDRAINRGATRRDLITSKAGIAGAGRRR
jgi:hypothetical protein